MSSFTESTGFKYAKNFLFGVGASVVIIGAWAKLTHLPWANVALTVGLLTEAFIFAMSGIVPPPKDYYWEKLYPGLDLSDGAVSGAKVGVTAVATEAKGSGSTVALDKMLDEAKIDQSSINRLGASLKKLSDNVDALADVSNAQVASDKFAIQATKAADSITAQAKQTTDALAAQTKQTTEAISAQAKHTTEAMNALTNNLDNLSKVYGNMLNAMRT